MMKQARCVLDQIHATVRFATELRLVQLPASLTPNGPNGPNHFLVIGTCSEVSHCLGVCYFACDGGMHLQFCKAKTHATEASLIQLDDSSDRIVPFHAFSNSTAKSANNIRGGA